MPTYLDGPFVAMAVAVIPQEFPWHISVRFVPDLDQEISHDSSYVW